MKITRYTLIDEDTITVTGTKLYRILYTLENNTTTLGGYCCENSIMDNSITTETTIVINSTLVDSYVDESIINNSRILDSDIVSCSITMSEIIQSVVTVDLTLCSINGENLVDISKIIEQ